MIGQKRRNIIDNSVATSKRPRDESLEIGDTAERNVEIYLRRIGCPYKRNVIITQNRKEIVEFDFVIPNAIIEVKGGVYCGIKIITQIQRMLNVLPEHIQIYVLFFHKSKDSDTIMQQIIKNYGNRIIYITSLTEIVFPQGLQYYTESCNFIRDLITIPTYKLQKYDFYNKQIKVYKTIYNKAHCVLLEDEYPLVNRLKYDVVDCEDLIDKHNLIKLHYVYSDFEQVRHHIQKKQLDIHEMNHMLFKDFFVAITVNRPLIIFYPERHIEGATRKCITCESPVMLEKRKKKQLPLHCWFCSESSLTYVCSSSLIQVHKSNQVLRSSIIQQ